jgi:hypothetical protein
MSIQLLSSAPPVGLDLGAGGAVISNGGPGTVSYSDTESPFVAEGAISSGATATLYGTQFFKAVNGATITSRALERGTPDDRLLLVERFLDVNLRDYAPAVDFNGGADTTAAINAASLALSVLATTRGQRVRIWGLAGAHLLVDGIRSYENLRWEFDDAQITKVSGVNPMFYPTLNASARTFSTTLATGRTVASTNTIHDVEIPRPTGVNVDRPGTLAVGGTITGAGIPADATITAIRPALREIDISANATVTASLVALSHNPSFGTLSNGSPTVTAITTPLAWFKGRTVTGTGIPGGTTVLSIDWTNPAVPVVTLSANATASGVTNLAVAGSTYFGNGRNIALSGGTFDPNGIALNGAIIYAKYVENFRMEYVTRLHNWGDASPPTWALDVLGYGAAFESNRCLGGNQIFMDGDHVSGGEHITFLNEYVESGDDAFAFVNVPGTLFASVDPRPIAHVTGVGNIGRSAKGWLLRVATEPATGGAVGFVGPHFGISAIDFQANGSAGKYRNGGIGVFDENAPSGVHADASNRLLTDISLRAKVDVGSTYHDGTNPYGVYVRGANDVTIDATVNVLGEGAATFERRRVREADRCTLNLRGTGGTATPFLPLETRRFVVNEANVSLRRQRPRLDEDFFGPPNAGATTLTAALSTGGAITALPVAALPVGLLSGSAVSVQSGAGSVQVWVLTADAAISATSLAVTSQTPNFAYPIGSFVIPSHATSLSAPWQARTGSNVGCSALLLPDSQSGVLRLIPGTAASSVMATDGVQVDTPALSWRALDGGLVIEARVRLSQGNGLSFFMGFANQRAILQMPMTVGTVAPAVGSSTAVGVSYDSQETVKNWWGVGAQGSVAVGQDFGVAPVFGVNATWATWRVEIDGGGTAMFELNGAPIGTRLANAVVAATALTPYIGVLGRATGLQRGAVEIDYVLVERLRA